VLSARHLFGTASLASSALSASAELLVVFINGIVIFSFLVIFVFFFVNENHTDCWALTCESTDVLFFH